MNKTDSVRCEFETHPAQWRFPAGEVWIAGWLEIGDDNAAFDVRAWIDGQIFLGLAGLPGEPADLAVSGRRRFLFLVQAGRGSRLLKLEAWQAHAGWIEFFQTPITVEEGAPNSIHSLDWIAKLPRFSRSLGRAVHGTNLRPPDEIVRAAAAKPLEVLPAPPFVGTLETPIEDGYVRGGRLLVSGWLAHGTKSIRKITARVSGGRETIVAYGLQRRDVSEQFPELLGGSHSHFVGMIELPTAVAEPALVLLFAETKDGIKTLVFARRFLPCAREGGVNHDFTVRTRPTLRFASAQFRAAGALVAAVRRHGVAWWDFKRLVAAARAPGRRQDVARLAAQGAFAESTPLSLYLSGFRYTGKDDCLWQSLSSFFR